MLTQELTDVRLVKARSLTFQKLLKALTNVLREYRTVYVAAG